MSQAKSIFIAGIFMLIGIGSAHSQTIIFNPDLPKTLVFQWRIDSETVHPEWINESFSISRDSDDLIILYGSFSSLEEAMNGIPELPEGVSREKLELLSFVNQSCISDPSSYGLNKESETIEVAAWAGH